MNGNLSGASCELLLLNVPLSLIINCEVGLSVTPTPLLVSGPRLSARWPLLPTHARLKVHNL